MMFNLGGLMGATVGHEKLGATNAITVNEGQNGHYIILRGADIYLESCRGLTKRQANRLRIRIGRRVAQAQEMMRQERTATENMATIENHIHHMQQVELRLAANPQPAPVTVINNTYVYEVSNTSIVDVKETKVEIVAPTHIENTSIDQQFLQYIMQTNAELAA